MVTTSRLSTWMAKILTVLSVAPVLPKRSGHVAVLNAINNACGVRIYELPATPDKVKAGLDIIAAGGKVEPPKKYFLGSDLYDELENIKANPITE